MFRIHQIEKYKRPTSIKIMIYIKNSKIDTNIDKIVFSIRVWFPYIKETVGKFTIENKIITVKIPAITEVDLRLINRNRDFISEINFL